MGGQRAIARGRFLGDYRRRSQSEQQFCRAESRSAAGVREAGDREWKDSARVAAAFLYRHSVVGIRRSRKDFAPERLGGRTSRFLAHQTGFAIAPSCALGATEGGGRS